MTHKEWVNEAESAQNSLAHIAQSCQGVWGMLRVEPEARRHNVTSPAVGLLQLAQIFPLFPNS